MSEEERDMKSETGSTLRQLAAMYLQIEKKEQVISLINGDSLAEAKELVLKEIFYDPRTRRDEVEKIFATLGVRYNEYAASRLRLSCSKK